MRKWEADYEFVPLNATEFLDEKVSAKWATLLPPSGRKMSQSFIMVLPSDSLISSVERVS